ncbi:phosphopantetheine binding protein [Alteromonadaceae bacterium 2753L.S.0a.02]|nr:phosphopantetheine binding protein [Alteromonadaceae bacterium 2753L.S.0a.02]
MYNNFIAQLVFDSIREVSDFASEMLNPSVNDAFLEKDFVDIGINSIDYNHILAILTDKLNIDFPPDRFLTSPNIGQCVNTIAHLYAESKQH